MKQWFILSVCVGLLFLPLISCTALKKVPDEDNSSSGDNETSEDNDTSEDNTTVEDNDTSEDNSTALEIWEDAIVTLYTFQDNSACNSIMTASKRPLTPYVSVALPFRFLEGSGNGPFALGDEIHVSFLEGRIMPNGQPHTGWVRIDDFCGDNDDDSYCLQDGLPNVDLYIGDWAESGEECLADNLDDEATGSFDGPGGSGQDATEVAFGPAPDGELIEDYGGVAIGDGNCGDCDFGKTVQPLACWHYDPGDENIEYCDCTNSNGTAGECDKS